MPILLARLSLQNVTDYSPVMTYSLLLPAHMSAHSSAILRRRQGLSPAPSSPPIQYKDNLLHTKFGNFLYQLHTHKHIHTSNLSTPWLNIHTFSLLRLILQTIQPRQARHQFSAFCVFTFLKSRLASSPNFTPCARASSSIARASSRLLCFLIARSKGM